MLYFPFALPVLSYLTLVQLISFRIWLGELLLDLDCVYSSGIVSDRAARLSGGGSRQSEPLCEATLSSRGFPPAAHEGGSSGGSLAIVNFRRRVFPLCVSCLSRLGAAEESLMICRWHLKLLNLVKLVSDHFEQRNSCSLLNDLYEKVGGILSKKFGIQRGDEQEENH